MTGQLSTVSAALADRGDAVGTWVQMHSPEAGELAAAVGFDFVVVDMEHGTLDLPAAAHMVRAIQGRGADAVVRVPSPEPGTIGRVLDAGARGVLVPGVRGAPEAGHAAAAAHFAPRGTRGACPYVPAFDHGLVSWDEARERADAVHVWLLIEHPDAVGDIEALAAAAAAAGATALVLGPFDLAVAMGHGGDHGHPQVRDALEATVRAAHGAGLDCVAVTLEEEPTASVAAVAAWRSVGCRITTALLDRSTLARAYRTTLHAVRSL
ncbi:HpcH/HpaI aldolase family protein [Pseudonocardia abyssalis]|jgi:2-keto-3-deoxy-L-rhamnonate aldolase RhmA|uniref:2-dehydro-3-deoxyglucarate aldolase n=1 Tax=Pseudonocardia abyssalis TaxID=2792008 RepID=A0ABS6US77_9PSEU|nr:aldolase/citrate lyase family protein [Pseudonocardia abyssalis]MBW0113879.1 2-dehydro-3-deoxyglucarate aldolase [Pseudonocardia abyssalis]MBW0135124.1 2-dehydro-3-deoxyglucarate aldolase [Pseudonocardia abyssalis]